jgi:DNA-3-methyladenine glycosylase
MNVWEQDAVAAAQQLIGYRFYVKQAGDSLVGGMISEVEAYTAEDAASHSFRGETTRNKVMFGEPGHLYIYFTYGMHWCANIVTGPVGSGQAVLIRGIEPDEGMPYMRKHRKGRPDSELTNGPAKVCQALGISGADNGAVINGERFILLAPKGKAPPIQATIRIGIRQDKHRLWRFIVASDV